MNVAQEWCQHTTLSLRRHKPICGLVAYAPIGLFTNFRKYMIFASEWSSRTASRLLSFGIRRFNEGRNANMMMTIVHRSSSVKTGYKRRQRLLCFMTLRKLILILSLNLNGRNDGKLVGLSVIAVVSIKALLPIWGISQFSRFFQY